MGKWLIHILLLAFIIPVWSRETTEQVKDSLEQIRERQEQAVDAERRIQEQEHELERKIREHAKVFARINTGRLNQKIKGVNDSSFRIDIQIGALDSILKNIPIPNNIEIYDQGIRIHGDTILKRDHHPPFKRTERKNIVKFGEDVIVGRNEVIQGDVVVMDGDATVYGTVEGGVVVVKGDIRLASTAWVKNDLVCLCGNTDVDPGAHAGSTNVFNLSKVFRFNKWLDSSGVPSLYFIIRLFRTILLLAAAVLICAAFPEQTRRVQRYIEKGYSKSLAAGLIVFLVLPFVFIVLIITILGIPIAVLLLPLAVIGAFLLGITAFGGLVGAWLLKRFNVRLNSAILSTVAGVTLFEIPSLLNKTISLLGPLFSVFFVLVGIAVFLLIWTPAFGAAVMTRFGRAPKTASKQTKSSST